MSAGSRRNHFTNRAQVGEVLDANGPFVGDVIGDPQRRFERRTGCVESHGHVGIERASPSPRNVRPRAGSAAEGVLRVRLHDKAWPRRSRQPWDGIPVHEKFWRQTSRRPVDASHHEAEVKATLGIVRLHEGLADSEPARLKGVIEVGATRAASHAHRRKGSSPQFRTHRSHRSRFQFRRSPRGWISLPG